MKVEDIKLYDAVMESYIDIENKLFKARTELLYEGNDICFEIFNDLKHDINTPDKTLMMKINESFTMANNYRRNKITDIDSYVDLIDNMLMESVKQRKDLQFVNNDHEDYVKESQIISDNLFNICKSEHEAILSNDNYNLSESSAIYINELLVEGFADFINKIKSSFGDKHEKIVERDGEWLKDNKGKLTKMNFKDIEIEVPSDYKSTFTNLINRHEIYDKNFKDTSGSYDEFYEKIKRFEDKDGNLKNGLDNYIRNGNSRREVSLKKISGEEVKSVVESMIAYCEEFLSGKGFIESKLTNIMAEYDGEESVKESVLYNIPYDNLKAYSLSYLQEAEENIDDTVEDKNNSDDLEKVKNTPVEQKETKANDRLKIFRDRQTGITVLMTISEERYFDHIALLKGLLD